jgi:hypothetical protein
MAKPFEESRDAILSESLLQDLKEFLRFRHLFRHMYGFELTWERYESLCRKLKDVFEELKSQINMFLLQS